MGNTNIQKQRGETASKIGLAVNTNPIKNASYNNDLQNSKARFYSARATLEQQEDERNLKAIVIIAVISIVFCLFTGMVFASFSKSANSIYTQEYSARNY